MVPPRSRTDCCSSIMAMTGWSVRGIELGAVGVLEPQHVAGKLDDGALHAQANAEDRGFCPILAIANRLDLALDPAHAEPARDEDAVDAPKGWRSAPRPSTSSASTRTTSTRVRLAMPA